tara:strand:+ start:234 stop:749 length:516 start_codon:yes stop_codon:yes gene_type:complete
MQAWQSTAVRRSSAHGWSPTRVQRGALMNGAGAVAPAPLAAANAQMETREPTSKVWGGISAGHEAARTPVTFEQENGPRQKYRQRTRIGPRQPLANHQQPPGAALLERSAIEPITFAAPTFIAVPTSPEVGTSIIRAHRADWFRSKLDELAHAPPIVRFFLSFFMCMEVGD